MLFHQHAYVYSWSLGQVSRLINRTEQFWSLKIRQTTFLNHVKFANPQILQLQNCEMPGGLVCHDSGYPSLFTLSYKD